MTDERDRHLRKTPPAGVQAQIAGPIDEFAGQHPTPVEHLLNENPIQTIVRRTGEAKNTSIDTLFELGELRREHGDAIAAVNTKVDSLAGKVDASIGQNDRILGHLIGIREKGALADIDDRTKDRAVAREQETADRTARRDFRVKLGAVVLGVAMAGAIALQAIFGKGCSFSAPPPTPAPQAPAVGG